MKVLVVGTGGSIVSGISTAVDQMVQAMKGYGYDVERLTAGARMRRRSNALNLENVTAVLADARAVFRRARIGRPDVVWIHTFGVPALAGLRALALVGAARLARRPVVVHIHAYAIERFVADGGPGLRLVLRLLGIVADAIVVLHEQAALALATVDLDNVHVLANWVDVLEDVAPLPAGPPMHLVFVGGLVTRKGVPALIEAVRVLAGMPVELRLVGGAGEDGPGALARLQHDTADLVAAGRLSFAGELGTVAVRAELRSAHLLVLPSKAEGTPMAVLEAMAEGRPVLVSDAGNMKALVESAGSGWVLPDCRPATIAAHIRRIADDPIGLEAAAVSARRRCEENHSARAARAGIDAILASATSP